MTKNPLKIWDQHVSWESAEEAWDVAAHRAKKERPLKELVTLPKMPGITKNAARFLKFKALKYLLAHDEKQVTKRYLLKWKYLGKFLLSFVQTTPFHREDDFFFYGLKNFEEFEKRINQGNPLIVVGFSYCHKPHECPSGRFTTLCKSAADNPVCKQCFIGKMIHALPSSQEIIPLFITTIHYIGEELCKIQAAHPGRPLLFLITACEMTLNMFADFGNMIGVKGVGVRLDGRICNTMDAFHLSEKGIKPGLTVVLPKTQEKMLNWVKLLRKKNTTCEKA